MNQGYIYIMVNPSMEGLVKIGKTTKQPEERAKELSGATGVPTPFILVYKIFVPDCDSAEIAVHNELENRGFRLSSSREFFNIPTNEAIDTVVSVCQKASPHQPLSFSPEEDLGKIALREGISYFLGGNDKIVNYLKAAKYFKKSCSFGVAEAHYYLGQLYRDGNGVRINRDKAIDEFDTASKMGFNKANIDLAKLLFEINHVHDSLICCARFCGNLKGLTIDESCTSTTLLK